MGRETGRERDGERERRGERKREDAKGTIEGNEIEINR